MKKKKGKLPDGWRFVKLGDIANFLDHKRIPVNEEERKRRVGPYPYYGATGQVGWIDDYIFDDDLVLLAEDGGPFGSKTDPIAYKISGKTWVNNHAHVLKPKDGVNINWLLYSLMLYDVTPFISGSTRGKLNKATASSLPIILPPTLDNQIAIASEMELKMAEVDKMRQAALRQKEAIAAMQGAILREVFPYKEGEKLPEGWRWEMLDNLFTIDKQQIAPSNSLFSTLSFIGLENIESNTRKYIPSGNSENSGDSTCFLFDDKHVLYGKLRPYLNKVYLPDKQGRCSMELLPLIPQNSYSRNFIASILQSKIVIDFAVKHSTGERMPRANIDKLKKLEVPIPSEPDDRIVIANELKLKMVEIDKIQQATEQQLEAIEALPGAILREVFDFEEK